MDKKLSINVDVTETRSLSEAAGIPMIGSLNQISRLDELKKFMDLLLDSKDLEITGAINIRGYLMVKSETQNTTM
jgi:hypothetical protein